MQDYWLSMDRYVNWSTTAMSKDDFYTDWQCRQMYKAHLKVFTHRKNTVNGRLYKEDPTIFYWDLMNEPRWCARALRAEMLVACLRRRPALLVFLHLKSCRTPLSAFINVLSITRHSLCMRRAPGASKCLSSRGSCAPSAAARRADHRCLGAQHGVRVRAAAVGGGDERVHEGHRPQPPGHPGRGGLLLHHLRAVRCPLTPSRVPHAARNASSVRGHLSTSMRTERYLIPKQASFLGKSVCLVGWRVCIVARRVFLNPGAGKRRTGISSSPWAAQEGQDFLANHVVPSIDLVTTHIWADNWMGCARAPAGSPSCAHQL